VSVNDNLIGNSFGNFSDSFQKLNLNSEIEVSEEKPIDHLDQVHNQIVDDYIKSKGLENDQPTDLLMPYHLRHEQLRNEVKAQAGSLELKQYFKIAFPSLVNDGENFVESEEYEWMCEQVSKGSEYLNEIDFYKPLEDNFQNLLKIDDASMETIFQIAKGEFHENKLEESLSIFALLHFLAPDDPDYSYRLGIVAKNTNKLDLALRAFDHAIPLFLDLELIDPELIVQARLYCADCHLKLGNFSEVKKLLDMVHTEDLSLSDWFDRIESDLPKP
jgi:tetratricopeptide (TPR) repeat protein